MNDRSYKKHDSKFKLKIALEAIKGDKSVDELCAEYNVLTSQVYAWKKQLEENGDVIYADKRKIEQPHDNEKKLQEALVKVTAERDFLERVLNR